MPPDPVDTGPVNRKRWIFLVSGVALVLLGAFLVFRPDKLVVDQRVDEQLDAGVAAALDAPTGSEPPTTAAGAPASPTTTTGPVVEGRGTFTEQGGHSIDGGDAVVLRQPDGSRLLVLDQLNSQNGPDLQLYLSPSADGNVVGGTRLAPLKGNIGTQTYELPDGVDLAALPNVVIWCERFAVPFGTAMLT